jgi:LysM repeat protein
MKTIFLSAGHSSTPGRDRGTAGSGFIEGVETAKMRKRIAEILNTYGGIKVVVDGDNTILNETLLTFRRLMTTDCIAVEIHFNSTGNPTVKGTESFVPERDKATVLEVQIAKELSAGTSEILDTPLRGSFVGAKGVKGELASQHKNGLGWMRLPGHNVLTEVEFISNSAAMAVYARPEKFEALCQMYARVLAKAAGFVHIPQSSTKTYTVRAGDTLFAVARNNNTTVAVLTSLNSLTSSTLRVGQILILP